MGYSAKKSASQGSVSINITDYEKLLLASGVTYSVDELYLLVGDKNIEEGWVIYVSIFKAFLLPFLNAFIDGFVKQQIPFKIPCNSQVHDSLVSGEFGLDQIGKVICIYPVDEMTAKEVAKQLLKIAESFYGPEVPSAILLKGCIYAQFNSKFRSGNPVNSEMEKTTLWPFQDISTGLPKKPVKWLNKKYFVTLYLKKDFKGFVYKALNFNKWYDIQWCVIKEGKANQCVDINGRSAINRIKWQFETHQKLSAILPIPKPIEIFKNGADLCFAMGYIEGLSFHDEVSSIQSGVAWTYLINKKIIMLLNYILQVVEILDAFHTNGFVHRDINPLNFIVDDKGKVWAIDIELCYDYINKEPNPAFSLGTDGYMSPAQRQSALPVIADDIYGLGGILIRTFTGCSPTKFNAYDENQLFDSLYFFIRNKRLTALVCACYHPEPSIRPSLTSVKHNIELYRLQVLNDSQTEAAFPEASIEKFALHKQFFNAFWRPPFLRENLWVSKIVIAEHLKAAESKHYKWYPSFNPGATGILYLLIIADHCGYDTGDDDSIFCHNFNIVQDYYSEQVNQDDKSLHSGQSGFGIIIAQMISKGLLEKSLVNIDFISRLLNTEGEDLGLANGIAGQGLAMLQCASLLQFPQLAEKTIIIANKLIYRQNSDGSWFVGDKNATKSGTKLTGLFHGVSGIAYFLLLYAERYYSESAKRSAMKALKWLLKQGHSKDQKPIWPVSNKNQSVDPWLEFGFTGVAFVFIKAYQILGKEAFKNAATSALLSHPRHIISNYLSHGNGLSGLGEAYLEAYEIFGEQEWLDRAILIKDFLMHTTKERYGENGYWLDGSDTLASVDFMSGHAGIVHFLVRLENPKKVKFPILSI